MNNSLNFVLLFIIFCADCIAQNNQGIIKNNQSNLTYRANFSNVNSSRDDGNANLISYSLEKYLPEIGNQGAIPSCVGWASTYYGMTIVLRMQRGIDYEVQSPWSVYNRYQYRTFGKRSCVDGCMIEDVLNILQTEGSQPFNKYKHNYCFPDSFNFISNALLDGWTRIGNSRNQIKSALLTNAPVIIGIDVMESSGDNTLSDKYVDDQGVLQLNGFENSNYKSGGHAMCIVAFNDTLQGGAFKIVNSWGRDWGDKGFCWIKYSDLKYISAAFAIYGNFDYLKKAQGKYLTEKIEFLNSTDSLFYVSLSYETKNGMTSMGWFEVPVGIKKIVDVSDRISNEVYWSALGNNSNPIDLDCNEKCNSFPVSANSAFEWVNDKADKEAKNFNFKRINPNNLKYRETIVLGYKDEDNVLYDFSEKNQNDLVTLNKNWDASYPLVDPYSGEVIIRKLNSKSIYTVYYMDNNRVKFKKGKAKALAKIKELKFIKESNLTFFYKK
jgi:hypothetical protein